VEDQFFTFNNKKNEVFVDNVIQEKERQKKNKLQGKMKRNSISDNLYLKDFPMVI